MTSALLDAAFGRTSTKPGIGNEERTSRECTVCGTTFDTERTTCPQCGSQISRTRETTPNARVTLLVAVVLAGVEMAYNLATGRYPREGRGA